jgi:hypothetical protein
VTASEITRDPDWPLSAWNAIRELKRQVNNLARLAADQDDQIAKLRTDVYALRSYCEVTRSIANRHDREIFELGQCIGYAHEPDSGPEPIDRFIGLREPTPASAPAKSSIICRLWTAISGGRP